MRTRNGFKASALSSASASSTGEVTRRFACTPASKAALRAWPLVTGTACGSGVQGNDFQSLGKPAGFPLSRACARVRKKGILECRSLGTRRALALLRVPSHHLANDHQMTPPLFAGAFRAFGPFAPLTAARLSGTASRALRPKVSHRAGLRGRVVERWASRRLPSQGASGHAFPAFEFLRPLAFLSPFESPAQRPRDRRASDRRSALRATAARLQLPALPEAPCCRSPSPGNKAGCKPLLSASIARRMSVMAIAERLVARVSFSKKLTGPERGPSKYESQRGCLLIRRRRER